MPMSYQIKPLTVGEIVDGAFQLYRNNFATFFGVAAALGVPATIIVVLANWAFTGRPAVGAPQPGELTGYWLAMIVAMPITFGSYILQHSVLTIAIADAYLGQVVSIT